MPPSPRRSSPPNNPGAGGRTNQEVGTRRRNRGSRLGPKQEPEPGGPNRPEDERRVRSLPYRPFREPDDAISEIPGPASVKERRPFCPADMGDSRNLRAKIQPYRMTAIFSRSFFVPVPGRSYFQPHRVIPPAQSTTANLCTDSLAQPSALIYAPIPRVDSRTDPPHRSPRRLAASSLPLATPCRCCRAARSASVSEAFSQISQISQRNIQRGRGTCQTDRF